MGQILSFVAPYLGINMVPIHTKARTTPYPSSAIDRFPLKDEEVLWSVDVPNYKPPNYTHPSVAAEPIWADKEADRPKMKFNAVDGNVNRATFHSEPYAVKDNMPLNYRGRTGLAGRGLLGKFGPNHAADPIVTRWQRDASGKIVTRNGKRVLEMVLIKRKDNGQWALPGGMVDAGDSVGRTLRKEFGEEALASIEGGEAKAAELKAVIDRIFSNGGTEIYSGYVDDPRNTDNAWMETTAVNFHDETGETFGEVPLQAGDDAGHVKWVEVSNNMDLYASHADFVRTTIERLNAAQ
eukprot:TRINITY_DN9235_c0_g3_i1.p1 TRINITY_DN9235_c0_g3~~TRINITY_DN9235_c0_g3_i1.p1  ORF type:complete len:295 (+),score=73.80 TRINITY_DN9235_c0_g3_i1:390-1274(+)